jgi:hypothetical protein
MLSIFVLTIFYGLVNGQTSLTKIIDGDLSKVYNDTTLADGMLTVYRFNVTRVCVCACVSMNDLSLLYQDDVIRVWLYSPTARRVSPLMASVRHKFGLTAMQLPVLAMP